MQPIRQIYDDAPASIPIPEDLQHQRIELIIWPLSNDTSIGTDKESSEFERRRVDRVITLSREERNERR
ncbi:hypothetical protein D5085_12525 [Ectothiorhodospiraceae bacterium BW-2]|nr:hypothetical protein D5085_12525 [Ectothiorhodospiraceae bacterium BW-2]